MARALVLSFFVFSSVAAMGQAVTTCPWVATGTAARILGGDVIIDAHVEGDFAGSCRFTRQDAGQTAISTPSIEILIGATDTHPCPQGSEKLKALGNEAVECRRTTSQKQQSDIIAGRIRNVYFAVTMTNVAGATKPEPADPLLADAYAASQIERLAEQVVGNLY